MWHHYAYKEKATFVYENDYNILLGLEISLDLETILVASPGMAVDRRRAKNWVEGRWMSSTKGELWALR